MEKSNKELLKERVRRVEDAIRLEVPDRVPIIPYFSYFPARYAGITAKDAYYDAPKWRNALKKTVLDFGPDLWWAARPVPASVLEVLDCKQVKWPGGGVLPDHTHQFVEMEYMKSEEYDAFNQDPSDWTVRTYLPRVFGALKPFGDLSPLWYALFGYMGINTAEFLAKPESIEMFKALSQAGEDLKKFNEEMSSLVAELEEAGFMPAISGPTEAPFDLISDYLRGMRGSMLDMYRQPDKVLEACETILPMMIDKGVTAGKVTGINRIFIPLHRGADGFMSLKQFETFYWPTFKKLVEGLIDAGMIPCPFFEGNYTSRLEYLLELPGGKVCGHFDTSDIFRVKEVLGGHMCIRGNVPVSILQTGTQDDVKAYCKKLIDVVGKDGGFIMDARGPMETARVENVKAMFDFTREYGVYR